MALDFLKSDKAVADEWNKPAYVDPLPAAKKKVLTKLDRVIASVQKEPSKNIARWYKTKKGKDGASVGLNVGIVSIAGDTTGGPDEIVKQDAVAFFKTAKEAIQSGKMDDEIREAAESAPKGTARMTAQRAPGDGEEREITNWKTYRRNIGRYGLDRANELGEKKFGKDELPNVQKEFEEKKDTELPAGWTEGWWKKHFKK